MHEPNEGRDDYVGSRSRVFDRICATRTTRTRIDARGGSWPVGSAPDAPNRRGNLADRRARRRVHARAADRGRQRRPGTLEPSVCLELMRVAQIRAAGRSGECSDRRVHARAADLAAWAAGGTRPTARGPRPAAATATRDPRQADLAVARPMAWPARHGASLARAEQGDRLGEAVERGDRHRLEPDHQVRVAGIARRRPVRRRSRRACRSGSWLGSGLGPASSASG